jgi:hypothetical protein
MTLQYEHITTAGYVEVYEASQGIFEGLLTEVRELSKKKPEATMSAAKVKIINRVLKDLLSFLKDEPEGKYLEELDDQALPQISDAVLIMIQFDRALKKFKSRYQPGGRVWITKELVAKQTEEEEQRAEKARIAWEKRAARRKPFPLTPGQSELSKETKEKD